MAIGSKVKRTAGWWKSLSREMAIVGAPGRARSRRAIH
jgi:hypothetical protein